MRTSRPKIRVPRAQGNRPRPGEKPVLPHGSATVTCWDYGPDALASQPVEDVEKFLSKPRPEGTRVRWLDIVGLNADVLQVLQRRLSLHPLAVEDALHLPQRPKLDLYETHLFAIAREILLQPDGKLHSEQVSFFLTREGVLISLQETPGDVWGSVRARIQKPGSQARVSDASFLLYALLDALVDYGYPVMEFFGERLEALEEEISENPSQAIIQRVHFLKRDLTLLRRAMWPMRDLIASLQREEFFPIPRETRTYLRDVYDHTVQIIDILETYRDLAIEIRDIYISTVSQRLNEIMKVLTVISTIFIPLTFLAGVYGMNFQYFPELHWHHGYSAFWIVCGAVTLVQFYFFRRKRWI